MRPQLEKPHIRWKGEGAPGVDRLPTLAGVREHPNMAGVIASRKADLSHSTATAEPQTTDVGGRSNGKT